MAHTGKLIDTKIPPRGHGHWSPSPLYIFCDATSWSLICRLAVASTDVISHHHTADNLRRIFTLHVRCVVLLWQLSPFCSLYWHSMSTLEERRIRGSYCCPLTYTDNILVLAWESWCKGATLLNASGVQRWIEEGRGQWVVSVSAPSSIQCYETVGLVYVIRIVSSRILEIPCQFLPKVLFRKRQSLWCSRLTRIVWKKDVCKKDVEREKEGVVCWQWSTGSRSWNKCVLEPRATCRWPTEPSLDWIGSGWVPTWHRGCVEGQCGLVSKVVRVQWRRHGVAVLRAVMVCAASRRDVSSRRSILLVAAGLVMLTRLGCCCCCVCCRLTDVAVEQQTPTDRPCGRVCSVGPCLLPWHNAPCIHRCFIRRRCDTAGLRVQLATPLGLFSNR